MYLFLLGTGTFRALGWPAATAIVAGLVPAQDFSQRRDVAERVVSVGGDARPAGGRISARVVESGGRVSARRGVERDPDGLPDVREARAARARVAEPNSWRSFSEGIRFLRRQPIILSTMTLDMVAVLFGGATALLADLCDGRSATSGATGFGWMRAMPSLGAIFMGLLLAMRPPIRHGGTDAAVGRGGVRRGDDCVRIVEIVSACRWWRLFALGAADNISVVIRATVLQLLTPDSMRGRVSAVSVIFIGTSNEIGEFESGVAAQWLGLVPAVGRRRDDARDGRRRRRVWPELGRLGSLEHLQPPEPTGIVE